MAASRPVKGEDGSQFAGSGHHLKGLFPSEILARDCEKKMGVFSALSVFLTHTTYGIILQFWP